MCYYPSASAICFLSSKHNSPLSLHIGCSPWTSKFSHLIWLTRQNSSKLLGEEPLSPWGLPVLPGILSDRRHVLRGAWPFDISPCRHRSFISFSFWGVRVWGLGGCGVVVVSTEIADQQISCCLVISLPDIILASQRTFPFENRDKQQNKSFVLLQTFILVCAQAEKLPWVRNVQEDCESVH